MAPLMAAYGVGKALQVGGDIFAGQAEGRSLEEQANTRDRQGQEVQRQQLWNGLRYNEETRRMLSTQRQLFGQAGVVLEGGPSALMARTTTERVLQRMETATTARRQVEALAADAENLRRAADEARTASYWKAGGDLFSGIANLGSFK
jgi:hypothetical protein